MRIFFVLACLLSCLIVTTAVRANEGMMLPTLDLSSPFATRSPWILKATRGALTSDPSGLDPSIPGVVTLCLQKSEHPGCGSGLLNTSSARPGDDPAWPTTRNIDRIAILSLPLGKRLLLATSGPRGVNGNHWTMTQLLAYDRREDRFQSLFAKTVDSNNNQEIRVIEHGPIAGNIIIAEPTTDAPYGYWITALSQDPATYRVRMRFRSATHYGDGNPLAVIDAEMPGILRRFGKPHILPKSSPACPVPHLYKGALWCTDPPANQ